MTRAPKSDPQHDAVTPSFPETTPQFPQPTHDFTLQAVMEMQRTLGGLCEKVDGMSINLRSQGEKIDTVRQQISFVKGALWVIGGLVTLAIIGAGVYLKYAVH